MSISSPLQPSLAASTAAADYKRRHGRGFWIVTFLFTVTMAFATAPTPLYVLYQERSGFSAFTVTVIFAAYALGVVVSLFLAGHVSDHYGRRRIIAAALVLNLIAAVTFMVWPDLPGLLLARFISGLGVGMLTATATAYITELYSAARPDAGSRRAEVVATAANIGGLGLGPILSGFMAQYLPLPMITPYLFFAALLVFGILLLATVPETVKPGGAVWTYRPQRVVVPAAARGQYAAAVMMAFVGFAMFGFFTSLAPSLISGRLGIDSHVVAGAVAFAVFAPAAAFQVISSRWPRRTQFVAGLSLLTAGLVIVILAIAASALPLLIGGGILAGAGVGITFKSAVGTVIGVSAPESRGEALAGLFLGGYLGMSVPVLLLGLMLQTIALLPSVLMFGAVMLALLAVTAVSLSRSGAAGPAPEGC